MKKFKYCMMAVLAICIVACSGGSTEVQPVSKKVNGPLGKFFEVVERDYKIIDGKLGVEFKRIAEGGPSDASWSTHPTFTVELQDEDGNVIATKSTDVVFTEKELEAVFSLGVDESASITFNFGKAKGVAKFKVSSKLDSDNDDSSVSFVTPDTNDSDDNIETDTDSDTENEETVSSSDSEDWDAVLDSYEKYVDQYISLLKKAKNGDMDALTEYPDLMEKAQNLSDKMGNAKDNMSASQWAKYNKITMKMAKAAQELQ